MHTLRLAPITWQVFTIMGVFYSVNILRCHITRPYDHFSFIFLEGMAESCGFAIQLSLNGIQGKGLNWIK